MKLRKVNQKGEDPLPLLLFRKGKGEKKKKNPTLTRLLSPSESDKREILQYPGKYRREKDLASCMTRPAKNAPD